MPLFLTVENKRSSVVDTLAALALFSCNENELMNHGSNTIPQGSNNSWNTRFYWWNNFEGKDVEIGLFVIYLHQPLVKAWKINGDFCVVLWTFDRPYLAMMKLLFH